MSKVSAVGWIIAVLFVITTNAASTSRDDVETGELQLTEDQYHGLVDCDQNVLEVQKKDEHQYNAVQLASYDIIIRPPTDCWQRYKSFMAANIDKFKALANKYCRNYIGCWCCPGGGLCVTFVVKPDFWRCWIWHPPIYKTPIPIFEPAVEVGGK